jgi:hypothetical protein
MMGKLRRLVVLAVMALGASYPLSANAQGKEKASGNKKEMNEVEKAAADLEKAVKRAKASEAFFSATTPLEVTLTTNIKRIRNDKQETPPWRSATLSYKGADGKDVTLPMQIKTRGIWRKKNCDMPPLRLNFKGDQTKGTLLEGINKPKLVNYCKDTDDYEQYVIQEAQLYRVYNLLTPASHRMRLLTVNYTDSASGKLHAKRTGILLEEPEVMAARNGGPILDLKGAVAEDLDPFLDALVGMFNYFIGNTDFSVYALHNVELVNQPTGIVLPVAFDFDFSGVVGTTYATPDPSLPIQNVRFRLFRGYCTDPANYAAAIAKFNEQKQAIYGLYSDEIGKMLKPKVVESTLKYFDEFYKTINDPKRAKREINEDCVKTN